MKKKDYVENCVKYVAPIAIGGGSNRIAPPVHGKKRVCYRTIVSGRDGSKISAIHLGIPAEFLNWSGDCINRIVDYVVVKNNPKVDRFVNKVVI